MNHNAARSSSLLTVVCGFCLAAFLLFLSGCESSSTQYGRKGYSMKFGVMGPGPGGKMQVHAETTQIHRHVDPTYAHGFEVTRRDGGRFMGYFEVRFPEPIEVTPELESAFTVLERGKLIRSEAEIHWGTYSAPFWFSESDPLGSYELSVYIDGELYRTVQYDVHPFGENVGF